MPYSHLPLLSHLQRINLIVLSIVMGILAVLVITISSWLMFHAYLDNGYNQLAILRENLVTPLLFKDEKGATDALATLHVLPNVLFACVFNRDGMLAAVKIRVKMAKKDHVKYSYNIISRKGWLIALPYKPYKQAEVDVGIEVLKIAFENYVSLKSFPIRFF